MAEPSESYIIVDDIMVRRIVPRRGDPYEHSCEQTTYEEVAHAIDALESRCFNLDDLHAATDLPWSQINLAMAFMKERGCIVPSVRRKHIAATSDVHCDAMIEWHALREKPAEA